MRHGGLDLADVELALMTIAATPLPTRFVNARHSLMNLSMPSRMANDWIGMSGTIASVAASVTKPAMAQALPGSAAAKNSRSSR